MRRSVLMLCCGALTACSPATLGIVLAPEPVALHDSLQRSALELATRVAARNGLRRRDAKPYGPLLWYECYSNARRPVFSLCDRATADEVQFRFYEPYHPRLSPLARRVSRELADSLRHGFGAANVRECRWDLYSDEGGCPASGTRNPTGGTDGLSPR